MKTKKLDLLDFKQNVLSKNDISNIKAGVPIIPKPTTTVSGNGTGGGQVCYYNFDGDLLYCESRDPDPSKDTLQIP